MDFEKIGRDAAERAACLLGSRKLASSSRAVIFSSSVAVEFLDLIADLLCADQVQRGKSLLAGKIGTDGAKEFSHLLVSSRWLWRDEG